MFGEQFVSDIIGKQAIINFIAFGLARSVFGPKIITP
jgi:hypothetical protein